MELNALKKTALPLLALVAIVSAGCSGGSAESPKAEGGAPKTEGGAPKTDLSGVIAIDGSSTVQPIMSAMAEEFMKLQPKVQPTVGTSGTGGGMKKFVADEIDIANASRPIEQEEIDKAKAKNIDFIELPIAFDGLSVVVNKENTWVDKLTVAELKKIWEPGSKVSKWSDVRAGWPATPIKLYGPGTDSGTFEYFTEAVNGKKKASRSDYTASEDDNTLVQGVAGDKGALGYFGYAYYQENQDKLKVVPIDAGKGAIAPSDETIANNTYAPLSRPLFIYVKRSAADRPEVKAFVDYVIGDGTPIVKAAKYIPLPDETYKVVREHWAALKTGTAFHGVEPGLKIEDILKRESGK